MDNQSHPHTSAGRKHWVLIETGGNQRYIFGSNRLRHVVGASQLVHEVGTEWVPAAVRAAGLPDSTVVMKASGKALLLVDRPADGQAVIRAVSARVLREAPGLSVTGVVGPDFDPTDDTAHEPARRDTYELQAAVRADRRDPLLRDRVFPWHLLCRDSGQPAAGREAYGDETPVPASAGVLARSRARDRAGKRLRENLPGRLAIVIPEHLDELRHSGWVAVVHADGNGIGGLFRDFISHIGRAEATEQVSLAMHATYQRRVADELDGATWQAVRDAIGTLLDTRSERELAGRLLPIVVGGDDVTLACDAALAVPFVRAFAEAFARRTAEQPHLSAIAEQATGHAGLTASAGIAVVKLHHPFATAYALAEELTVAAKQFSVTAPAGPDRPRRRTLAAFDLHVAHTSTLRGLAELREYVESTDGERIARYAGPYLIDRAEDLPDELRHRSAQLLDRVSDWLGPQGWLSAAQAHALREAADRSFDEYRYRLALVTSRAPGRPADAHGLLDRQPGRLTSTTRQPANEPTNTGPANTSPNGTGPGGDGPNGTASAGIAADDVGSGTSFLRLFDALHLHGLRLDSPAVAETSSGSTHDGGEA